MACATAQAADPATLLSGQALAPGADGNGPAMFALRDALEHMPQVLIEGQASELAYFVDVAAALDLTARNGDAPIERMRAGGLLRAVAALEAGDAARWEQAAGIAPDAVRYLAGFGRPANMTTLWGLHSREHVASLMQTLPSKGFAPYASPGLTHAVANGDPMAMDLERRNPEDPWLGARGQTSIAAPLSSAIVQASAPQAVAQIQQTAPAHSLANHPAVRPALDALQMDAGGQARLVQAIVVAPPSDVAQPTARAVLRTAHVPPTADGVPPYLAGIVADVQRADTPTVTVALTYADCTQAEFAGQALQRLWQAGATAAQGSAALPDATAAASVHPSEVTGNCAVLATFGILDPGGARNPAFDAALQQMADEGFPLLDVVEAEYERIGNLVAPNAPPP